MSRPLRKLTRKDKIRLGVLRVGELDPRTGEPWRAGEPCSHPGCLSHTSHPCEGCGRLGGAPRRSQGEGLLCWPLDES